MNLSESCKLLDSPQGSPILQINHARFRAQVALQGAHLLEFHPVGQSNWFYLSPDALFLPGKAVRGGVPVCWPWFGPSPIEGAPAHGFARTALWTLGGVRETATQLDLVLHLTNESHPLAQQYVGDFHLEYRMVFGERLQLSLTTHNLGKQKMSISQALHSYFATACIEQTAILGLNHVKYFDALTETSNVQKTDKLEIREEVDRIYYTRNPIQIQSQKSLTTLVSEGSGSSVIWNPWAEKAKRLADLPDDDFHSMVCIETANVGEDRIEIKPGQQHTLKVIIARS